MCGLHTSKLVSLKVSNVEPFSWRNYLSFPRPPFDLLPMFLTRGGHIHLECIWAIRCVWSI